MHHLSQYGPLNLLRIPLELWLEIAGLACNDDGTTAHVLSRTSHHFREISKLQRYRTVKIKGWKQLYYFEHLFSDLDKGLRRMVNLYVEVPSLFKVAYPEWAFEPEDDPGNDPDYDPSPEASDDEGTDDELEYAEMSESENDELREDLHPGASDEVKDVEYVLPDEVQHKLSVSGTLGRSFYERVDLTTLSPGNRAIGLLEFAAYAALGNILEYAATSLEVFTLHWEPFHDLRPEAILPALPKLRSLSIYRGGDLGVTQKFLKSRQYPLLDAYPSLQRLDLNSMETEYWDGTMFSSLTEFPALYITLPCLLARQYVADLRHIGTQGKLKVVRSYCMHETPEECNSEDWSVPNGIQIVCASLPLDYEQEWLGQVTGRGTIAY